MCEDNIYKFVGRAGLWNVRLFLCFNKQFIVSSSSLKISLSFMEKKANSLQFRIPKVVLLLTTKDVYSVPVMFTYQMILLIQSPVMISYS